MKLSFDAPPSLIERLQAHYAEPHRRYHTWSHILACFRARDELTRSVLPAVDLALLFHDAVYDPTAADNEERSADLLVEEGRRAWLDERLLQHARELVMATRHDDTTASLEAALVVDSDLSILGADDEAFDLYERQIRAEYQHADDGSFAMGRRRILESFLERPTIYGTPQARVLWEDRARANLARSLATQRPGNGHGHGNGV